MDRKIVSDGTKTLIAHIGNVEVSRPELITGLFFVGTDKGEAGDDVLTVQFGLNGWEIRDQHGTRVGKVHMDLPVSKPLPEACLNCAAEWLCTKLETRHQKRLATA